eukprot:TRINITY_DN665_c0_g1_i1.p1 TRINITY_DN665_c0_g1~~TRINITY_DN665_c0_g1_i1.p1  ORF type:complete len:1147 (+),score=335.92 TRINITY_DN665_c0_g1_i1:116-3442(+)
MAELQASVRCLILLLAVCCISIAAFICTFIAVTSGDRALDSTKDAGSEALLAVSTQGADALNSTKEAGSQALDLCFSTARESIMLRTADMLGTAADLIELSLLDRLDTFMRLADRWYDRLEFDALSNNQDTDAYYRGLDKEFWLDYSSLFRSGLGTTMAVIFGTRSGRTTVVGEDSTTLLLPPHEKHHLLNERLYDDGRRISGTMIKGGGFNITLDPVHDGPGRWEDPNFSDGSYESDSCWDGEISPKTGQKCNVLAMRGCRWGLWGKTNGRIDDGACRRSIKPTAGTGDNPLIMIMRTMWPVRQARWSPITPNDDNVGVGTFNVWSNTETGQKVGYFFQAIDLRVFGAMLGGIRIGGDASRERSWIMTEDDWMRRMLPFLPFLDQRGSLVASSNGTSYTREWHPEQKQWGVYGTRKAYNSNDPLIRAAARHFEDNVNGSYGAVVDTPAMSFRVNSSLTGGGWWEWEQGDVDPGNFNRPRATNVTVPYLNGRLSAAEQHLEPRPGYAADGEEFFATVRRLRSRVTRDPLGPSDGRSGRTEWFLVIIIDRKYVLGDTDEAQAQSRADIDSNNERVAAAVARGQREAAEQVRKSDEAVQEELDRDRIILYAVVAGSAAVLVMLSVFFSLRIVAPIQDLAADMAQVASMRLEEVDEHKQFSALQEVAVMQLSFVQMVRNLREFRSYMPASALVHSDDDEEQVEQEEEPEEEAPAVEGTPTKETPVRDEEASDKHSSRSGDTSVTNSSAAGAKGSCHSSASSTRALPKGLGGPMLARIVTSIGKKTAHPVTRRRCTLLLANRQGFLAEISQMDPKVVSVFMSVEVACFTEIVQHRKGIVEMLSADHLSANFGCSRPLGAHRDAAVAVACKFCGVMAPEDRRRQSRGLLRRASSRHVAGIEAEAALLAALPPTSAVASGHALCGDFGSTAAGQRYMIIGPVFPFAVAVERLAAAWCCRVLLDHVVAEDAASSWQTRLRKRVMMPKAGPRPFGLWEVTEPRGAGKGSQTEWMYQLAAQGAPKWEPYSTAVAQWSDGNMDKALATLAKAKEADGVDDELLCGLQALEDQIKSQAEAGAPVARLTADMGAGVPAAIQCAAASAAQENGLVLEDVGR